MISVSPYSALSIVLLLVLGGQKVLALPIRDTLKAVTVTAAKPTSGDIKQDLFAPGEEILGLDSTVLKRYRLSALSDLLANQTSVFVKSYGLNGLATLNIRGSSAAQTAVIWNGIPIQNAALGIADVSTMPVYFMSRVGVVYGSSSALWGSGNVGGAIVLSTESNRHDTSFSHPELLLGIGSFGQRYLGLGENFGGKKWCLTAKYFGQSSVGNFEYTDIYGSRCRLSHSAMWGNALSLSGAFYWTPSWSLTYSLWYSGNYREIPQALFEAYSDKRQASTDIRAVAALERTLKATHVYARSSFVAQTLQYDDDTVLLHTKGTVNQWYEEFGLRKPFWSGGNMTVFCPVQVAQLIGNTVARTRQQVVAAIAGAVDYRFFRRRLDVAMNLRAEDAEGNVVLLPGGDAALRVFPGFKLRVNVQKTYRLPTLNELYYFPGGNLGLKPESGIAVDGGYTYDVSWKGVDFQSNGSYFNRDVHNWILWLGGAVWTPQNIAEVSSHGVETRNEVKWHLGGCMVKLGVSTTYVIATTVQSNLPGDGSIGKQIPYTPRYSGQGRAGIVWKNLELEYGHTYTGYRFITTDESEWLAPYQVGNVSAMVHLSIWRTNLEVFARCNNVWNTQYQVVNGRPTPGPNFLVGIKCSL